MADAIKEKKEKDHPRRIFVIREKEERGLFAASRRGGKGGTRNHPSPSFKK